MQLSIPTPTRSAVEIGPLTIHFYALCIIAGVSVAIWLGNKRFLSRFPSGHGVVGDVAIFAVPAGVIGGRLYHVITTPEMYFGSSGNLSAIFRIWNGGLGIWGAISLGSAAAYFVYRNLAKRRSLPPFLIFADALAPGLLIAQAIGRWGNWFNGELFGRPLSAPWAVEIPRSLRPAHYLEFATFHPTFLYESLWCAFTAVVLLNLSTKHSNGAIFALYISFYSSGRFFIEGLRVDPAHTLGGVRLNQYVALIMCAAGALAFTRISRRAR